MKQLKEDVKRIVSHHKFNVSRNQLTTNKNAIEPVGKSRLPFQTHVNNSVMLLLKSDCKFNINYRLYKFFLMKTFE